MSLEIHFNTPRTKSASRLNDWAERTLQATNLDSPTAILSRLCDESIEIMAAKELLQSTWDHMAKFNGQGAGPNGRKFRDFTRVEKLAEIAQLHSQLTRDKKTRKFTYRHGGVLEVTVPKRPGSTGTRTLSLPDVQDRVVASTIVQVLEPLLRNRLDERSFCRFTLGPWYALADAKRLAETEGRWNWIIEDIRDAFGSVSLARLFKVLESYLPSRSLLDLLRRAVDDRRRRGLYQGSPLSPLLMNVFLDFVIDRPWHRLHPKVPLLRYMDDIAILCGDDDDAGRLYSDLQNLVSRHALELKHGCSNATHALHRCSTEWLGYSLRQGLSGLAIRLPLLKTSQATAEWRSFLTKQFIERHHKADAQRAAEQFINGILAWAGPALPSSDTKSTYELLRTAARAAGFEEIQSYASAHRKWRDSYERWRQFLTARHTPQQVFNFNELSYDAEPF